MLGTTASDVGAIAAKKRGVKATVTFSDFTAGVLLATGYDLDVELKDQPDSINRFVGSATAKCVVTLPPQYVKLLTPYASIRSGKERSMITIDVQITSDSYPSTSTFRRFTGRVFEMDLSSNGPCQITCYDRMVDLVGKFNLPAGAVQTRNMIGTPPNLPGAGYTPLAVIDAALRAAQCFLTPAPLISKKDRDKYCILAVSGAGGLLPEKGFIRSFWDLPARTGVTNFPEGFALDTYRVPGKFHPSTQMMNKKYMPTFWGTAWPVGAHTLFHTELWFRLLPASGSSSIVLSDLSADTRIWKYGLHELWISTSGQLQWRGPTGTATNLRSMLAAPGTAWHCVTMETTLDTSGNFTANIWTDGTLTTPTALTGITDQPPTTIDTDPPYACVGDGIKAGMPLVSIAFEGLECYWAPAGSTFTVPSPYTRYNLAPDVPSIIDEPQIFTESIPPQNQVDAGQCIQDVASAYGGIARFRADGTFVMTTRRKLMAQRIVAPTVTFGPDKLPNLAMNTSRSGLAGRVTANVYKAGTRYASFNSALYQADQVITLPPGQTVTTFDTDGSLVSPIWPGTVTAQGTNMTVVPGVHRITSYPGVWYDAVPTSQNGDPAAQKITNLRITVLPLAGQIQVTFWNPNTFSVDLWTPGGTDSTTGDVLPEGPAFAVMCSGKYYSLPTPITALGYSSIIATVSAAQIITAASNPNVPDSVDLPDNAFRNDAAGTQDMLTTIAGDVYAPVPSFTEQSVPGHPAVEIGDMVGISDGGRIFPSATYVEPVMVVGIRESVNADAAKFEQSFSWRAPGPPRAWIIGLAGRTELGTTTRLPNA